MCYKFIFWLQDFNAEEFGNKQNVMISVLKFHKECFQRSTKNEF